MAKKRPSKKGKLTLKPIVKQIDSHIKKLKAMKKKKGTTPQQKKKMDRHIGRLQTMRAQATDGCDAFFLPVD